MPRSAAALSPAPRLSDFLTLGALTRLLPVAQVEAALGATGRQSQRQRQLPATAMVYYVIALGDLGQPDPHRMG